MWNSRPHAVRDCTLARTEASPGIFCALLRCRLLVTHFTSVVSGGKLKACRQPSVLCAREKKNSPQ